MFYVQDGCPMQVLTYVVFVLKILLNMTGVYLHYSSQVACRPVHSKRLFNSKILHRGKDMVFNSLFLMSSFNSIRMIYGTTVNSS